MAVDTLDVITPGEARDALHYGDATSDLLVEPMVTAVSRRLDTVFGAMVYRSVRDVVSGDGVSRSVLLSTRPIVAGSLSGMLTTWSGRTMYTQGTESHRQVYADIDNGYGAAVNPGQSWPAGVDNLEFTYKAGRYATTALVDDLVKQAAILMLRNLWESTTFETVAEGLGTYDFPARSFPSIDVPAAVYDPATRTGLLAGFARLPAVA